MSEFKQYRRTQTVEMCPVHPDETVLTLEYGGVSVSDEDIKNGSPKKGDMIARDPKNHDDQWLVAKQYFEDNFEEL
jgi:hypothetical protein